MPLRETIWPALLFVCTLLSGPLPAAADDADEDEETTDDRPTHQESARTFADDDVAPVEQTPPLPRGVTLEEVLDAAARGPERGDVHTVKDRRTYGFLLFDQLEARVSSGGEAHLGFEHLGWVGGPVDRLWFKNEGEWSPADGLAGETESDLLYGRLLTPFFTGQVGVRYANAWSTDAYDDTWSLAIALQGLVPYKIELDASLYLSESLDLTSEIEAEYGIRLLQRLVVQPRLALRLAAQDIEEENIGWGLSRAALDVRIRYEFRRELAPYLGVRGQLATGRTRTLLSQDGQKLQDVFVVGGARVAF